MLAGRQRPLRVVEVGLSWPLQAFLVLKLRRLAERGIDVRVVSFMRPGTPAPEVAGVPFERLADLDAGVGALPGVAGDCARLLARNPRHLRSVLGASGSTVRRQLPLGLWRLNLRLSRLRADVVHFEWLTVASNCLPFLRVWPGALVVSCHGSEFPAGKTVAGRPPAANLPGVFANASTVHVIAEAKRDEAIANGLDASKACVIRTGVDAELFRPAQDPRRDESGFSVVSVGWLRWLKGYEYALLAIAELAREEIPVTLDILGGDPPAEMGEASERARILQTARDLGLEGRVRLRGNVDPGVVSAHLQRADAFLHSSLSEGLPNVVLEAMACAVPVVATDVGGTREAFRDGVEGFLVPARKPAAAARALRALWRDPALRRRMGQAGRARVEAEFTIERQIDEWVELYERVVRDG